ncbi:MAG: thioesterase [Magnetococcales bacterium]|nr:thioesterase [Magnetococcales bacterium]
MHPNDHYEFDYRVVAGDSARLLCQAQGDDFPDVLATSRMIGLMELAAARLMRPELQAGELSVGVSLDVTHQAATPLFETIRVRATRDGREGKLYRFRVEVRDEGGIVGSGTHLRAIVRQERLIENARRRIDTARASG